MRPAIPSAFAPAAAAVAMLLLLGCESAPTVRSDYDRTANFGAYHTFNFVSRPATDELGYSTLVTQQIETAVTGEMQKRGYARSDHPDLLVDFSAKLREKQRVESTPVPYYGYRAGLYTAWPAYAASVQTVDYTEGTLNVDLIDAGKRQMVWEGVGIGEITRKKMENRAAAIDQAVANIFAKYPFRAGAAQPIGTVEQ